MENCLFCKIASKAINSDCIYEDELVFAFNDIDPKAPVHFLVIPKEHIGSMAEITPENSKYVARSFEVIAELAGKLSLMGGFRVVSNCGVDAGQSAAHLHFHVLAGREMAWPPG